MASQTCISIGINQYQFLPPLGYGLADAVAMEQFFINAAGWDPSQCLLLTDTSPSTGDRSTYPDQENINRWIKQLSWDKLHHGDLVWFFFSGCGISFEGEDYLIPIDGNVEDLPNTCISLRQLYQQFKDIGVNALVFLDANRSQHLPLSTGIGAVTAQLAQEYQIPTFLSCQSHEFSHEDAGLGHGLFTTALLEALNYHHDLNLGTIDTYLTSRLAELSEHHWKPLQTPVALLPTNASVHRPVFSATTQSSISTAKPETYTPPIPVTSGQDVYAPYTPPTPPAASLEDNYAPYIPPALAITPDPIGTGAMVKIDPIEPTKKQIPHWASISVLITLLVAAGGAIYAFNSQSPDFDQQQIVRPAVNNLNTSVAATGTVTAVNQVFVTELARVKAEVQPNNATSRLVAIRAVRKIPATSPAAVAEVKSSIDQWSVEIAEIAQSYASQKKWQFAIDIAKTIPADASNYATVQASMSSWKGKL